MSRDTAPTDRLMTEAELYDFMADANTVKARQDPSYAEGLFEQCRSTGTNLVIRVDIREQDAAAVAGAINRGAQRLGRSCFLLLIRSSNVADGSNAIDTPEARAWARTFVEHGGLTGLFDDWQIAEKHPSFGTMKMAALSGLIEFKRGEATKTHLCIGVRYSDAMTLERQYRPCVLLGVKAMHDTGCKSASCEFEKTWSDATANGPPTPLTWQEAGRLAQEEFIERESRTSAPEPQLASRTVESMLLGLEDIGRLQSALRGGPGVAALIISLTGLMPIQ